MGINEEDINKIKHIILSHKILLIKEKSDRAMVDECDRLINVLEQSVLQEINE